jgi:hypothetical protein
MKLNDFWWWLVVAVEDPKIGREVRLRVTAVPGLADQAANAVGPLQKDIFPQHGTVEDHGPPGTAHMDGPHQILGGQFK